jgi:hypothetical protein
MAARYLNNPRDALKHFNAARRDIKWCSQALLAMAEIYLNPENNISWASEGGEADGSQSGAAAAAVDAETQEAIKAASTLLQQLRPADMESNKYKVCLGCWYGALYCHPSRSLASCGCFAYCCLALNSGDAPSLTHLRTLEFIWYIHCKRVIAGHFSDPVHALPPLRAAGC